MPSHVDTDHPMFQSAPSHGGRPKWPTRSKTPWTFQSAPSHGGRRYYTHICYAYYSVSICALARRATFMAHKLHVHVNVSICALARRATGRSGTDARADRFNLRPRTEGDLDSAAGGRAGSGGFNLRPRTEGDDICPFKASQGESFNLRPRTEGDFPAFVRLLISGEFQSAPSHGGRRSHDIFGFHIAHVSICALARRATSGSSAITRSSKVSICALARRATAAIDGRNLVGTVSICALARRATAAPAAEEPRSLARLAREAAWYRQRLFNCQRTKNSNKAIERLFC